MLLRTLHSGFLKNSSHCSAAPRFISQSSMRCDGDKITQDTNQTSLAQKTVYPKTNLRPKVLVHPLFPEENPFHRTFRSIKHDYDIAKNLIQGKPPPPFLASTDVLVVGGGMVGTSIAYHLIQRTGPGLKVTVVEKDPPELSTSLRVANNGLYQQLKIKPAVEMAQYAADFYRKLNYTFSDPDLPPIDVGFFPNNSLQLAYEEETRLLDDLSELYKEVGWKHQMLTPSMLKQKFPWLNTAGVGAGCLGMQKEGMFNKLKALAAMRTCARKDKVDFCQGEVIGFEFVDQSDLCSTSSEHKQYYSPRRAVIQLPSGDTIKRQFGYVIIAAGTSIQDVYNSLQVSELLPKLPVQPQKCSSYEVLCPDGPGIEMPMVMESTGLKFRKSDLVNSYTVWDDTNCEANFSEENLEADNGLFANRLFPQLIHRVPSFKDAKLISSQAGLIDRSVWDDNVFVGPLPSLHNVLIASGFGNDEFLFAPAVGQGIAEIILEREFCTVDLNCFRFERIESNLKLNECPAL